MFDFTTTTFIHDADMIEANPNSAMHASSTSGVLRLENKIFKVEDVVAIYKNPFVAPMNAKLVVDVAGFMTANSTATRFKLDFYLRRSGDNNSYYSNDFIFKGKDFHYEWTSKENSAAKVAKMINKIIRLYGDVYLKVYTDDDDKLVFESDNYGIFTEAELKVYVAATSDCCTFAEGGWEVKDELDKENACVEEGEASCDSTPQIVVPSTNSYIEAYQGINGFGTYEQILKDLRLPTMENMRWMSTTASEMPIPGNKYTQYTIHQISCRGVLGGSAVGEVTHSKTTHVFFVPSCGCEAGIDSVMDAAISEAFGDTLVVNMGSVTKDPTPNPVDFENITYGSNKADTTTDGTHEELETTELNNG